MKNFRVERIVSEVRRLINHSKSSEEHSKRMFLIGCALGYIDACYNYELITFSSYKRLHNIVMYS